MSTIKKGILTASNEWAKHLRPWGKRTFWKSERRTARDTSRKEAKHEERNPPGLKNPQVQDPHNYG